MTELVGLLFSVGVIAIAGAGFATMFGLAVLRARFFGAAVVCVLAALALPLAVSFVGGTFDAAVDGVEQGVSSLTAVPGWIPVVLGLGYTAILVAMVRRRGRTAGGTRDPEQERTRSRQRRRMPPRGEEV